MIFSSRIGVSWGKQLSFRQRLLACFILAVSALLPVPAAAQQSPAPSATPQPPSQNTPEISQHDETPTFKVKVNLVEVRVVVRDAKGKAIGNLKQEDFQLLDNGKPQVISKFSVERADEKPPAPHEEPGNAEETAAPSTAQPVIPSRYIAYLFDDMHVQFPDLAQARNAAILQIQVLQPTDRAAIYTTSGQVRLDFTDDRAALIATLNRIVPHSLSRTDLTPCPDISYYMADAIENRNDAQATQVAAADAVNCGAAATATVTKGLPAGQSLSLGNPVGIVHTVARRVLETGEQEIQISLTTLQDVVRRIASMPGQRIIILVSPGFMNINALPMQSEIANRALHSGVVINSLDPAGLYTNIPDASAQRSPSPNIAAPMLQYQTMEQQANRDILADLADATGGSFFHNNNDLKEGFGRLAGLPEVSYLLGFSPQDLKTDGKYHKIKVTLKPPAEGAVQARKGYYAPNGAIDSSERAKLAIQDAVFSQEEVSEIPVQLHTQFFKPDESNAKLSVLVHMDVRRFRFVKADGRNNDDVTVVSAIFDRDGNFISGTQKVLQMHLKDATLESSLNSGVTLKSSFDVKPGRYIVRLVVRDADGQLAAQSSAVEIP
ncbi:MAG: VWA domain-containing protein [Candidatus Korobacteraceae bacterium]